MKKFVLLTLASFLFTFAARSEEQKNIIIFVADGLRAGSVNAKETPALDRVRTQGVRFDNSHSLFPTVTTANASAIATGHALGDTGNFSNNPFPVLNGEKLQKFLKSYLYADELLKELNTQYHRNYLGEVSLLAWAREHGFSTAAVGKIAPTAIQDVQSANFIGTRLQAASVPTTIIIDDATGLPSGIPLPESISRAIQGAGLPTTVPQNPSETAVEQGKDPVSLYAAQQSYFIDAFLKVVLPEFEKAKKPFVAVYWCGDPDITQHRQSDSLHELKPGINGATSIAAVKNADANLQKILDYLDAHEELAKSTNVIVTADHGFSTISKKWLNEEQTEATKSYATQFTYRNLKGEIVAPKGTLPQGFLAIDLAHALGMRLFDPSGIPIRENGVLVYPEVNPQRSTGQYPLRGNGLIGARAVVGKGSGADIAVASSGGCALIYLLKPNEQLLARICSFLAEQDYVGGIFVNKKQCSKLPPGALGLDQIYLQGATKLPTPTLIVPFRNFALDQANPTQSQVIICDTAGQEGQGSHGSFGRGDTFNFMAAMGPNFKKQYVDGAPVSNADIAVTCAKILGLDLPSVGKLRGRVMQEALVGGPAEITVTSGTLTSEPTSSGLATRVLYQDVGEHRYFDAGGFPGRTVGIPFDTSIHAH